MTITSFFKSIADAAGKAFAWITDPKHQQAIKDEAVQLIQFAAKVQPEVALISQLAGPKVNDAFNTSNIVSISQTFLKTVPAGTLTEDQKETILFDAAKVAITAAGKEAGVPDSLVEAGILTALRLLKAVTNVPAAVTA